MDAANSAIEKRHARRGLVARLVVPHRIHVSLVRECLAFAKYSSRTHSSSARRTPAALVPRVQALPVLHSSARGGQDNCASDARTGRDRLPLSLWTPECMLMFKVAVVQQPPVVLDRAQTVSSAVLHIAEAAAKGATLVVFPE